MDDGFDIGVIVVVGIVLLGFAALYVWMWRGNFLLGKPTGFRLEEHRRQLMPSMKLSLPPLGVLALLAGGRILDLCHVSRVRYAFWTGAIIASDLWLIGIMVSNIIPLYRQARAKRERQRNPDTGQSPLRP